MEWYRPNMTIWWFSKIQSYILASAWLYTTIEKGRVMRVDKGLMDYYKALVLDD